MVLDAKALTWAGKNNIDTAKLKAAKVPIYGKWYFPEIPPGVAVVNLETGEQEVFDTRMLAGELIWAPEADLRRAGLLPPDFPTRSAPDDSSRAMRQLPPEPLLAMARPPGFPHATDIDLVPVEEQRPLVEEDAAAIQGIHMPKGSIAPFVLGVGFCIVLLGVISNWIIAVVGLIWMLIGSIGWIRIGMLEQEEADAHH